MNLRGVKESGTGVRGPDLRVRGACRPACRRRAFPVRARARPGGRVGALGTVQATHSRRGLPSCSLVLRAFASGLHGADRRRGGQQRRAQLQAAEEQERRDHADDHGRAGRRHVRRDHRARRIAHVHIADDPAQLSGCRPATSSRPSSRSSAAAVFGSTASAVLPGAGVHRGDPGAGGEHRVQRLPDPGLDPGRGRLPAAAVRPARRPARVQQRHRDPRRCWPAR